jgi:hypothetical protein
MVDPKWNADFKAAEQHSFEASLAATPSQRLAWLENALALAYKFGALRIDSAETREEE